MGEPHFDGICWVVKLDNGQEVAAVRREDAVETARRAERDEISYMAARTVWRTPFRSFFKAFGEAHA